MTQEQLLLRTILDQPEEHLPRLVYADKLDELGGEANTARAEFIRLQVENPDSPRVAVLLRKWGAKWIPRAIRPGHPSQWSLEQLTGDDTTIFTHFPPVALDVTYPYCDYLKFSGGFIEEMGVNLPWRAVDMAEIMPRFTRTVRLLFSSQPLKCVDISWEYYSPLALYRMGRCPPLVTRVGDQNPVKLSWVAELSVDGNSEPTVSPLSAYRVTPDRKDLCRMIPASLAAGLAYFAPRVNDAVEAELNARQQDRDLRSAMAPENQDWEEGRDLSIYGDDWIEGQ